MTKDLRFVKLAGIWFAHIPDYPGDPGDLVMVEGADTLCDSLDNGDGIIDTVISDDEDLGGFKLNFEREECDGAVYEVNSRLIWLCSVTKYVFNHFPKTIYVYECKQD